MGEGQREKGRERERERERIPNRIRTASMEPNIGSKPRTVRSRPDPKPRVRGLTD